MKFGLPFQLDTTKPLQTFCHLHRLRSQIGSKVWPATTVRIFLLLYAYAYVYIYIYICACVCVCISLSLFLSISFSIANFYSYMHTMHTHMCVCVVPLFCLHRAHICSSSVLSNLELLSPCRWIFTLAGKEPLTALSIF